MKRPRGVRKAKLRRLVTLGTNKRRYTFVLFAALFTVIGVSFTLFSQAATPVASFEAEAGVKTAPVTTEAIAAASGGSAIKFGPSSGSTGCTNPTVNALLVPSCGAWLGGFSNDYVSGSLRIRVEEHEARIGRQVSFTHTYHGPTDTGLSTDDKYFINRPNTYLLTNWKPASSWADGDGSNATVNSRIDSWANSMKSVAPHKVLFIVAHEPENDVTSGGTGCTVSYVGSSGTPAQYRAMWQNVRNRFDAAGVNNVVWAVNYMSAKKWVCLRDDLWPGNNLVDWVIFNQYPLDGETFLSAMSEMYDWLIDNSDTTHNYGSKPFGIGEWGSWQTKQADVYKLYDDGRQVIANGDLPNLKLYTIFDAIGTDDSRVGYNDASQPDSVEQQHYNSFVTSPGFVK